MKIDFNKVYLASDAESNWLNIFFPGRNDLFPMLSAELGADYKYWQSEKLTYEDLKDDILDVYEFEEYDPDSKTSKDIIKFIFEKL